MYESLIESIVEKNYTDSEKILREQLSLITEKKLLEMKKMIASEGWQRDWQRGDFEKSRKEASQLSRTYYDARQKEMDSIKTGTNVEGKPSLRGKENFREYQTRKSDYFSRAARNAIQNHGEDIEAAARHMHKLVSGIENKDQPWMHTVGGDFERLHPTVQGEFKTAIRNQARALKDAKDPEKIKIAARRAIDRKIADDQVKEYKRSGKIAWDNYNRQQGKKVKEKPEKVKDFGKEIGDEIPFVKESRYIDSPRERSLRKVEKKITKAFSKKRQAKIAKKRKKKMDNDKGFAEWKARTGRTGKKK